MRIDNWSSPRPTTLTASGESVGPRRIETIAKLARRDVLPFASGHRRGVDAEDHRDRRFVDGDGRNRDAMFDVGNRLADRDVVDARETTDVARRGVRDVHALESVERIQLGDFRFLDVRVELADGDGVADLHAAVEDAC